MSNTPAKTFSSRCPVLSVKEKNLPELDDDFAQSLGQDFDDVDALRESVRESLTNQAEAAARNELEQKSLDALCEAAIVNASPILYERELEAMQADRERMLRQQGLDLPTYLRFMGKSADEFLEELRPSAERRLVGGLVLRKLAEVEEIEVTDQDIPVRTPTASWRCPPTRKPSRKASTTCASSWAPSPPATTFVPLSHSRRVLERLTDITPGQARRGKTGVRRRRIRSRR